MFLNLTTLPSWNVAYMSQRGSYGETTKLWKRLTEWARLYGMTAPDHRFFGISYDEKGTPDNQKTSDACVCLPQGFKKNDKRVQYKSVKGGSFLLYHFYDSLENIAAAYDSILKEWLPSSIYVLDDRNILEFMMNDVKKDPEGKAKINIYFPVKKKEEQVSPV